jgi:hypothetical protein
MIKMSDTPANHVHLGKVGNLTIYQIMDMDNDGLIDEPDLIDNLWSYLCDSLKIRARMEYDWSLDQPTYVEPDFIMG